MGEYTLTRELPAPIETVFDYFVEPSGFAVWFVVPGYRTPAERIRVDARPGGVVEAVMVSESDGTEIPFSVHLGDVDPPRRVVLHPGADETIGVELHDDAGSTRMTYAYTGASSGPGDIASTEVMLDHLARHVAERQGR